MNYQNTLIKLLDTFKNNDSNFEVLKKYRDLINNLSEVKNNMDNIKDKLYFNPYFIENSLFQKGFTALQKYASLNNSSIDKLEIINLIDDLLNLVNEEYQIFKNKFKYYDDILLAINENRKETLIEFINLSFKNKYLSREDYINLSCYIMTGDMVKVPLNKEVIIEENISDISLSLTEIFKTYGYDVSIIPAREMKKLLKYAKLDNLEEVLSFLKENNITINNFKERIKIITDLIIYYDYDSINKVKEFLIHNACSLNTLLGIGIIFFGRDINFKFQKKLPDGTIEEKDAPKVVPQGNMESFMYIIDLIKKDLGRDLSYPITDADLANKNILFTYSKELIERNLTILRQYGIITGNHLPKAISSLNTVNTEYLLDRYIEAGLYEYIKEKQPALTPDDREEFRWFKIKRARHLRDNIFFGRGIKQVYMNDESLYGISKNDKGIKQDVMDRELIYSGLRNMSININEEKSDYSLGQDYFKYFNYTIQSPTRVFNYIRNSESYPELGTEIEKAFLNEYSNLDLFESDPFINHLDSIKIKLNDGNYNPIKQNDYEYRFSFQGKEGMASTDIIISRQKVIRLYSILKKNNLWFTDDASNMIKENTILSVLLKDTIVSKNEVSALRGYVCKVMLNFMSYKGGRYK